MDFTKPFVYLSAVFGTAIIMAGLVNGYANQALLDAVDLPHARLLFFLGVLLVCFVASLFGLFYFWSFSLLRMIHSLVAIISLMLLMSTVSAFGIVPMAVIEFKVDTAGFVLNMGGQNLADPNLAWLVMTWGLVSIVVVIVTLSAIQILAPPR